MYTLPHVHDNLICVISDVTDYAHLSTTIFTYAPSLENPCYNIVAVNNLASYDTYVSSYPKSFYILATDYKLVMWIWTFFQHITTTICYNHDYIIVFLMCAP